MSENNVELPGGGSSFNVNDVESEIVIKQNPFIPHIGDTIRLLSLVTFNLMMIYIFVKSVKILQSISVKKPEYFKSLAVNGLVLDDIDNSTWLSSFAIILCLVFLGVSLVIIFNHLKGGMRVIDFVVLILVFGLSSTMNMLAIVHFHGDTQESEHYNNWVHDRYGITLEDNEEAFSHQTSLLKTIPDGKTLQNILKDDKGNLIYQVIDEKDSNRIFLYDPLTDKELPVVYK